MTILPAISRGESLPIGLPSSPASSGGATVVSCEFNAVRPLPLPDTQTLDAAIGRYEQDPGRARLMREARRALARSAYGDAPDTLTAMRLTAGLSQAQLAERMGTSQSHIARIERGQNDPTTGVIERIASALAVDATTAFQAIRRQRELCGGRA